jgi:hypothetical protein
MPAASAIPPNDVVTPKAAIEAKVRGDRTIFHSGRVG